MKIEVKQSKPYALRLTFSDYEYFLVFYLNQARDKIYVVDIKPISDLKENSLLTIADKFPANYQPQALIIALFELGQNK